MEKITGKEQIYQLYLETIKNRYKYSNCYFQPDSMEEWLKADRITCYSSEQALLMLVNESDYLKLFFYADDFEWVHEIEKIKETSPDTMVIEVVTRGEPGDYDFNTMIACRAVVTYERLRSSGIPSESASQAYFYCTEKNHKELRNLMDRTFMPIGDRIPTDAELEQFLVSKSVIGIREDDQLAGFLIFEDMRKTSYVRMICVNEAFRGKGFGNELMKSYFSIHKDFKSFTLWCKADNRPALNLYMNKWNYKRENLYNYIFII